ncbi:septation protein A [Bordetella sp. FB-8]|uniref:septation protein A n=1 Tax=Bordetella sp. FB-8 TaxID=1159870 RepID=UPI00035C6307|nr:septation protein A [Bordetella sp. FB-8]
MKKFLFDLLPLILFFVVYRYADIYAATATAVVLSIAQIIWLKATRRAIETTHWINLAVIVLFGGATLLLHDDAFIKWKPTVLYWIFGAVLIGGRMTGRNPMRKLMGQQIVLPETAWNKLNFSWALFFLAAGFINLYVAFSGRFTEAQWVSFKVFGLMGLLLVFVIGQSIWLSRHMQRDQVDSSADRGPGNTP